MARRTAGLAAARFGDEIAGPEKKDGGEDGDVGGTKRGGGTGRSFP